MKNIWLVSSLLVAASAGAQTAPVEQPAVAAPAPQETKAAEPPAKPWYEKVKLEGTLDAYYGYRFQGGPSDKVNEQRIFDISNNTFSLGYGKLALSMPAEPAGFRLDLGFGPGADLTSTDTTTDAKTGNPVASEMLKHVQQAYGTVKLFNTLSVDIGKFVTSAGAEVIEAKDNWLYSRSMLFGKAIPYAHAGLRLSMPIGDLLTIQGGILNGWDSVLTSKSWKTFNLSANLNLASTGTSVFFNFYGGPDLTPDVKLLFDVVVNQNIGDKVALNLNGDFGKEGAASWYGVSLMGKVMVTDAIRLAARVEYFGDPQGVRSNGGLAAASYVTATIGAGFIFSGLANVELRPELRHDQALSTTPYVNGTSASQTTLQLAAVAWF